MATKKIKSALCFEPFDSELALLFACRVVLGSRYLYVQGRSFRSDFSLPDELEELFIKNKLLDEESCSTLNVSKTKHLITQVLRRCNESRAYKNHPIVQRVNSIANQLQLSDIEKQVMLVILLSQIDKGLEEVISEAEKHFTLEKGCSLFSIILEEPPELIRTALRKDSKLRSSQLLDISSDNDRCFSTMFDLERSTTKMIMELDRPTESFLDYHFELTPSDRLPINAFDHLASEQTIISSTLDSSDIQAKNYLIYGKAGLGKTEFVRALAHDQGYQLFEISSSDDDGDMNNPLERLASFCVAKNFLRERKKVAILLDESEDIFGSLTDRHDINERKRFSKAWFNKLLEEASIPVFWVSNYIYDFDPAFQRRFTYTMEMPALPKSKRRSLIAKEMKGLPISNELKKHLVKNGHITPAIIKNLKQTITALKSEQPKLNNFDKLSEKYLKDSFKTLNLDYKKMKKPKAKPERFYKPEYTNCNYSIQTLTEKFSTHPGGRLCLFGPPGTGKTEYAHYLAKQLGKKLLVKGPSDFLDMWVGGTEKNIANAFKEAKTKKAILLIDEVDTLLSNRDGATRSWEVSQVNEMLTQIQNFEGILIATTNRLNALDPAIFRRFHFKVGFEYMTFEQSQKLLKHHLKGLNVKGRMTNNLNEKLQYCGNLTPGDFAVVSDRLKFLGCKSIEQYIHELMEETKHRRSKNKSIGFSAIVQ